MVQVGQEDLRRSLADGQRRRGGASQLVVRVDEARCHVIAAGIDRRHRAATLTVGQRHTRHTQRIGGHRGRLRDAVVDVAQVAEGQRHACLGDLDLRVQHLRRVVRVGHGQGHVVTAHVHRRGAAAGRIGQRVGHRVRVGHHGRMCSTVVAEAAASHFDPRVERRDRSHGVGRVAGGHMVVAGAGTNDLIAAHRGRLRRHTGYRARLIGIPRRIQGGRHCVCRAIHPAQRREIHRTGGTGDGQGVAYADVGVVRIPQQRCRDRVVARVHRRINRRVAHRDRTRQRGRHHGDRRRLRAAVVHMAQIGQEDLRRGLANGQRRRGGAGQLVVRVGEARRHVIAAGIDRRGRAATLTVGQRHTGYTKRIGGHRSGLRDAVVDVAQVVEGQRHVRLGDLDLRVQHLRLVVRIGHCQGHVVTAHVHRRGAAAGRIGQRVGHRVRVGHHGRMCGTVVGETAAFQGDAGVAGSRRQDRQHGAGRAVDIAVVDGRNHLITAGIGRCRGAAVVGEDRGVTTAHRRTRRLGRTAVVRRGRAGVAPHDVRDAHVAHGVLQREAQVRAGEAGDDAVAAHRAVGRSRRRGQATGTAGCRDDIIGTGTAPGCDKAHCRRLVIGDGIAVLVDNTHHQIGECGVHRHGLVVAGHQLDGSRITGQVRQVHARWAGTRHHRLYLEGTRRDVGVERADHLTHRVRDARSQSRSDARPCTWANQGDGDTFHQVAVGVAHRGRQFVGTDGTDNGIARRACQRDARRTAGGVGEADINRTHGDVRRRGIALAAIDHRGGDECPCRDVGRERAAARQAIRIADCADEVGRNARTRIQRREVHIHAFQRIAEAIAHLHHQRQTVGGRHLRGLTSAGDDGDLDLCRIGVRRIQQAEGHRQLDAVGELRAHLEGTGMVVGAGRNVRLAVRAGRCRRGQTCTCTVRTGDHVERD